MNPIEYPPFRRYDSTELGECCYETVHPSGLRILVTPKDMTSCYAALGVAVGSFDRLPGQPAGVAHFLEHKMFETVGGGDAEVAFAALGAEVNAYTTYDKTVYLFSCTPRPGSDTVSRALGALLRMVGRLHVTPASVKRERGIIREEIRMGADDPWEGCSNLLLKSLYRRHPIREDICGSERSVGRITEGILREAFSTYYDRGRMVLAVCGATTPSEVLTAVDACLKPRGSGQKTAPPPPARVFREPSAVFCEKSVRDMRTAGAGGGEGAKPVFAIGIKDPQVPTDPHGLLRRDLSMCILSEMLFSCSEDFYNDLYELGLITPGASYGSSVGRGYGYYDFTGESDDPDAVWGAFQAYVDKLTHEGLSRASFERSRRIQYADHVSNFDSTEGIGNLLLTYAMDGLSLFDLLPLSATVTFEEIEALFRETFRPGQYALAVVYPPQT